MIYAPSNWYWVVGGDQDKVWSSTAAGYVNMSDESYAEWLEAGGRPTPIGSIEDLAQVFAEQYPGGMLTMYANAVQWTKAIGGYQTTVGEQSITFPTSTESMGLISGKVQRLQQPDPPTSISWQIGPTSFIDIPAADFTALATQIADFVQETFDMLKTVFSQIETGTITTREQVDVAFA